MDQLDACSDRPQYVIIAFGFKALGILGTSPDPKKMNCDISIFGQFNNTGGMSYIGLDGQLWLQAKLLERNNAPVKGTLNIIYDFTSKWLLNVIEI